MLVEKCVFFFFLQKIFFFGWNITVMARDGVFFGFSEWHICADFSWKLTEPSEFTDNDDLISKNKTFPTTFVSSQWKLVIY